MKIRGTYAKLVVERSKDERMSVQPFKVSSTPLSITEVVELLQNPPEDGLSTLPPAKPSAGEVYLYTHGDDTSKKGY